MSFLTEQEIDQTFALMKGAESLTEGILRGQLPNSIANTKEYWKIIQAALKEYFLRSNR